MANKNVNYPYKPISNVLSANDASGALAVAEDIAYDWNDTTNTDGFGNPQFVVTKTLKEKIQELENESSSSETINDIQRDVNNIKSQITSIDTNVQSAQQAATDANTAKVATQAIANSIASVSQKVDSIDEIAQTLATNLNIDALYQIMTTDEYNQKVLNKELNKNTIYFLYDGVSSLKYSLYARSISEDQGTVSYSGDHLNVDYGTQVTITATPKSGYQFAAWKRPNGESYETVSNNSTINVTINADIEYVAWFTSV